MTAQATAREAGADQHDGQQAKKEMTEQADKAMNIAESTFKNVAKKEQEASSETGGVARKKETSVPRDNLNFSR